MRKTTIYLSCIALAALSSACNEEYIETEGKITIEGDVSLTVNELHYPVDGCVQKSSVEALGDWAVGFMPEWLSTDVNGGQGSMQFDITAARNSTFYARHAIVTYTASGFYDEFQHITQDGEEAHFTVEGIENEGTINMAPAGEEKSFALDTNVPVSDIMISKSVESESWYEVKLNTATKHVEVKALPNENLTARTSNWIYISYNTQGTEPVTKRLIAFRLRQEETRTTVNTKEIATPTEGANYKVRVDSDIKWYAEVEEAGKMWIDVDNTPHTGTAELLVTVMPNSSVTNRSANIYIFPYGGDNLNSLAKIMITQKGFQLELGNPTANINVDGTNSSTVDVFSNSKWTITEITGDWLSANVREGNLKSESNHRATVEFKAAGANPLFAARTSTVTFRIDNTPLAKTVTIRQEPQKEGIDVDREISFGWKKTSRTINMVIDGSWRARVIDDSWLHLNPVSGTGKSTLTLTVDQNNGESRRSNTIIITDKNVVEKYRIEVTQEGQFIQLGNTSSSLPANGGTCQVSVSSSIGASVVMRNSATDASTPSWVSIKAEDENTYVITAKANPSTQKRTAEAVFTPTFAGNDNFKRGVIFSVEQKGRELTCSKTGFTVTKVRSEDECTLTIDGEFTHSREAGYGWFTYDISENSDRKKTLKVWITENKNTARFGKIIINLKGLPAGEEAKLEIPIKQAGPGANVDFSGFGEDEDWNNPSKHEDPNKQKGPAVHIDAYGEDEDWTVNAVK